MKEDPLLVGLAKFINHWSGANGEAADMPDINDFLSRGQVQSKIWITRELSKIIDGSLGNVVFYGGWYNFIAHFLFQNFDVDNIYSLDLNEDTVDPSRCLYDREYRHSQFHPIAPEEALIGQRREVGIGRRYQSDIHLQRLLTPDPFKLTVFNDSEEFFLQTQ